MVTNASVAHVQPTLIFLVNYYIAIVEESPTVNKAPLQNCPLLSCKWTIAMLILKKYTNRIRKYFLLNVTCMDRLA